MIGGVATTGVAIRLQAERTQLEQWESSFGTPQQVALRCRIVLAALAGQDNVSIAQELGVSRPTVQLWRKRVGTQGIGEVWEIAPRSRTQSRSTIKARAMGSLKRPCTASPRA